MDLFKEVIPSITTTKKHLVDCPEAEKHYLPFIVNKALSNYLDCVLYANEMNRNYDLDKKLQYDYLFYTIKQKKRQYVQWPKQEKNEYIEHLKLYYGFSTKKAKEALALHSEEQLQFIKEQTTIGGRVGKKK